MFLTDSQDRIISREVIPINNCDCTVAISVAHTKKAPPPEINLEILSEAMTEEKLIEALDINPVSATQTIEVNVPAGMKFEYTMVVYGNYQTGYALVQNSTEPVYFEYIEDQRVELESITRSICGNKIEVEVDHGNKPTQKQAVGIPITFPQPNCGGTTEVTNYVGEEHTIFYTTELGGQVSLSASTSSKKF